MECSHLRVHPQASGQIMGPSGKSVVRRCGPGSAEGWSQQGTRPDHRTHIGLRQLMGPCCTQELKNNAGQTAAEVAAAYKKVIHPFRTNVQMVPRIYSGYSRTPFPRCLVLRSAPAVKFGLARSPMPESTPSRRISVSQSLPDAP
jgi:hypothetical protein